MSPPATLEIVDLGGAAASTPIEGAGTVAPSPMSAWERQRLGWLQSDFDARWSVPIVLPISFACLEAGRLKGPALERYIEALEAVHDLGPDATLEAIADVLEHFTLQGASGLLFAAEVCQLFSEELAAEAFLRVGRLRSYKGQRLAREGLRRHRSRLREAWRAWSCAQVASSRHPAEPLRPTLARRPT